MGADGSIIIDTRINTDGLNSGVVNAGNILNKLKTSIKGVGVAIGAAFAVRQIVQFGKEASKAAREASDSMMGLRSILEGQGRSFSDAKKFIDEYIQDGLIPATDATTAYKNLASRGYDDTQIQQVMTALKDASAYGRQASYSMGEAVKSATEGLKNENSVLVDNAGVTKNVAKMWEDYARSIGTTSQNLTQQQKIQAEVSGILAETRFQTGDAARVANTLSGEIQRLSFGFNNFKIAVGNIVNPIMRVFLPVINAALTAVTKFANTIATVVNSFFGTEMNMVADSAKSVNAAYDESANSAENLSNATKDVANSTKKAQKANKSYLSGLDDIKKFTSDNNSDTGSSGTSIPNTTGGNSVAVNTIPQKTNSVLNQVGSGFSQFADKIKKFMEPLTVQVQRFAGIVGDAFSWFYENVLVPIGKWTVNEVLPRFFETLAVVLEIINNVLEALKPIWNWFWENVLKPVAKWTADKFLKAWDLINEYLRKFADWIKKIPSWGEVSDWIAEKWKNACDSLKKTWDNIKELAKRTWDNIRTNAEKTWRNVTDFLGKTWNGLKNTASNVWNGLKNTLSNAWDNIKNATSSVWSGIKSATSNVWNSMKTAAANTFDGIKNKVSGAWNSAKSLTSDSWKSISNAVSNSINGIYKGFSNLGGKIKTSLSNAFKGLASVLKGPINSIIGTVNGLIRGVVNGINIILKAFNKLRVDIPSWVPGIGGRRLGFNFNLLTAPQIPYLAKGAVIPPNAPFMAMLGDQKRGTNIEAPLSTIEEALENVLAKRGMNSGNNGGSWRFTAQINRRTLFDELLDEAKIRQMRTGRNPFEMA